ncbi:hypothetical protein M0R72_13595 [Candidatus Pacearchaeota archaeon]|nr:hypothetical protein [Candidatus Pacearchaeota archaeon]
MKAQWMKPCAKRKTCHERCRHRSLHEKDRNCALNYDACPACVPEKKGKAK